MKKFKRLGALVVALSMLLSMTAFAANAKPNGAIVLTIGSPTMSVNGASKTIDAEGSRATLYKGNTMLPLRSVVENMGGSVSWNAAAKQIMIKYNGSTVTMTLGSKVAYTNGVQKQMTVAPFTDNGRTYVWLRALEFFPGVTVNWRADTRQATVVYPMVAGSTVGGQSIKLRIRNNSSVTYTQLRLAPAGTENWGENILQFPIHMNGTVDATTNVAKQKYDLQGTSYYGGKTYWRNLDFTKAGTNGSLNIIDASTCTLMLDGMVSSGTDAVGNISLYNATGQAIRSIVYGPAGSNIWSNELLMTGYLANNNSTLLTVQYMSAYPYYDFRVTYTSGVQYTFRSVNVASQWGGTQLVRFNANGQVSYSGGGYNDGSYGTTSVTFKNNSGKTVYELRMASTNTDSAFRNAENLIDTTRSGSTDDFRFDLAGLRTWYIRAYDRNGKVLESGRVTFSSTTQKSATISLKRNGDFIMGSDSSASDELLIANLTDQNIYGMFFLDPDDDDYGSNWDYDDFDDDYTDVGDLDAGEYDTFDLDLYGDDDNELRLIVFKDKKNFVEKKIRFSRNISDIGVIAITGISGSLNAPSYDDYADDLDDDKLILSVYNNDSKRTLEKVMVRDADDGDEDDDRERDFHDTVFDYNTKSKTGTHKRVDVNEWKNHGDYDFLFVFDRGDNIVLNDIDLSDYNYYVQITVDEDDAEADGE